MTEAVNVTVVVTDNSPSINVTAIDGSTILVNVESTPIQIHTVQNGVFDLPESFQSIAVVGDVLGGDAQNPNQIQVVLAPVLENPGEYDAPRIKVDRKGRIVELVDTTGGTGSNLKKFTVQFNDEREWAIPAVARQIIHVFINQLDYMAHCAINPAGSGNVVYTPPANGYNTEAGDSVIIHWR